MLALARLLPLVLSVIVLLVALPTAAAPNCTGELHEKSRLGLMPPACGEGRGEASLTAAGPPAIFLGPPVSTAVSSWPQVLAAADTDGDGRAEASLFSTAYFDAASDNRLHLLDWNGSSFTRRLSVLAGADPAATVASDLDGDGRPDIVVALAGEDSLAIFNANNLATPQKIPQPGSPDGLAAGDFTGDLRPDLVVVNPLSDTISIRGGSNLALPPIRQLPFATDGYSALEVSDLDNNGFDDIIALRGAGYATNSVVVFLQRAGAFLEPITLSPATGGYLPHSLAVGDLNNDGRDDIAVVAGGQEPNAFLSVFLQTDAGFSSLPPIATFHIPGAVAVADVTHDGLLDVVIAHDGWRTVSVYVQQAAGGLAAPVTATLPYSSRYRPDALAVADLTGDGGLDIALAERTPGLTVLTNNVAAPTATIVEPAEGATVQSGYVLVQGGASASAIKVQVRVKGLGDWQEVPVVAGLWQAMVSLPSDPRPYTIEARAVDAAGIVQAPWTTRRVTTALVCYAIADNGQQHDSPDRLMRLDMQLGLATLIGTLGTREVESLAFQPTTGVLFVAERDRLRRVDLATSVTTAAAQPFGNGRGVQGTLRLGDVQGLSFEPTSGALYAVMRRSQAGKLDLLFRVDPQTGALVRDAFGAGVDYVPISGPGVLPDVDDIAFAPETGLLYGVSNTGGTGGVLITIDPATGAGTVVGELGVEDIEGLTVAPSGALYGVTGYKFRATADRLWTIDVTGGAAALVGPMGIETDYEGLACLPARVAPPPSAQALEPRVTALSIDSGTAQTSERTVTLRATTVNQPAGVLFAEYGYDITRDVWQLVGATRRVSPAAAAAGVRWTLTNEPGMHYIQAWAIDDRGVIIRPAQQAFVNYVPRTIDIVKDVRHIYRYTLAAGETLRVELTSLRGDADVTIWTEEITTPTSLSAQASAPEGVTIQAERDGLYQLEVRGVQAGSYQLKVVVEPPLDTQTTSLDSGTLALVDTSLEPVPPLTSEPDRYIPPETERRIYLPLLRQ